MTIIISKEKKSLLDRADKLMNMIEECESELENIECRWFELSGNKGVMDKIKCIGSKNESPCGSIVIPFSLKPIFNTNLDGKVKEYISHKMNSCTMSSEPFSKEEITNGFYYSSFSSLGSVEYLYQKMEEYFDNIISQKAKFNYMSPEFRKARHEVFIRDGEKCAKCGFTPIGYSSKNYLSIDHIKPISLFPDLALDIENMQVLCIKCNKRKSNDNCKDYRH